MSLLASGNVTWGITGPGFLAAYGLLAMASLLGILVARWRLAAGSASDATEGLGEKPHEVAYLNGGPELTVLSALSSMRVAGTIVAEGRGRVGTGQPLGEGADELERAVHEAAAGSISRHQLATRAIVRTALENIRQRLEDAGLLLRAEQRRRIKLTGLRSSPRRTRGGPLRCRRGVGLGSGLRRGPGGEASGWPGGIRLLRRLLRRRLRRLGRELRQWGRRGWGMRGRLRRRGLMMAPPPWSGVGLGWRQEIPHGISLSLGGAEPLARKRIAHLAACAQRLSAPLVSEHIAFVWAGGMEAGHLLPVPRSREALDVLVRNVRQAQDRLPVPLALESIAALFDWPDDELTEADFLIELLWRTDAWLLPGCCWTSPTCTPTPATAAPTRWRCWRSCRWNGWPTHTHATLPAVLELLAELCARHRPPAIMLECDGAYPPAAELYTELATIAGAAGVVRITA